MKIYVCIDDTDNIDSIGTGTVADYIKERIKESLGIQYSMTTRHQLLIHDDVPYTSHNSSMCFELLIEPQQASDDLNKTMEAIKDIAIKTVQEYMAEGSDPGLCIATNLDEEAIHALIAFGQETKTQIKRKNEAYALAKTFGVFLCELGGTGDGVIGALAGLGLRLSGNDGEVKGGLKDIQEGTYSVSDLLLRKDIDVVVDITREKIILDGLVHFKSRSKSILRNNQMTLYIYKEKNEPTENYIVLKKKTIRQMELNQADFTEIAYIENCKSFVPDMEEEQLDTQKNCPNCFYRRWTARDFVCLKGL